MSATVLINEIGVIISLDKLIFCDFNMLQFDWINFITTGNKKVEDTFLFCDADNVSLSPLIIRVTLFLRKILFK